MHAAFTNTLRQAVDRAQQKARQLNQEFVGTEHLFLSLLDDDACEAARALRLQNLNPRQLRSALVAQLPQGKHPPVISGDLPLSPKAQRAINTAIVKAQSLGDKAISTRLLFLTLLDQPDSLLVQILRSGGADNDALQRFLAARPEESEK